MDNIKKNLNIILSQKLTEKELKDASTGDVSNLVKTYLNSAELINEITKFDETTKINAIRRARMNELIESIEKEEQTSIKLKKTLLLQFFINNDVSGMIKILETLNDDDVELTNVEKFLEKSNDIESDLIDLNDE